MSLVPSLGIPHKGSVLISVEEEALVSDGVALIRLRVSD